MSDADRYVSSAELQQELPFEAADFPTLSEVAFDSALDRALAAASDHIEAITGTRFVSTQTTETMSHPGYAEDHDLPLSETPVMSVDELDIEDEDDLTEGDDYHVHDTHIELDPDGELSSWPTDRRSIEVTWTYGHDSVPDDITRAVIRLARAHLEAIELDALESDGEGVYRSYDTIAREVARDVNHRKAPAYGGGAMAV